MTSPDTVLSIGIVLSSMAISLFAIIIWSLQKNNEKSLSFFQSLLLDNSINDSTFQLLKISLDSGNDDLIEEMLAKASIATSDQIIIKKLLYERNALQTFEKCTVFLFILGILCQLIGIFGNFLICYSRWMLSA